MTDDEIDPYTPIDTGEFPIVDPADPAVIDPTATTADKTPEPDIEPAEGAIAADAPRADGEGEPVHQEPYNSFGEATWRVGAPEGAKWALESYEVRDRWVRGAQAAIATYDAWLQGRADAYAEQVAAAPTFDQHVQAAVEAGVVRAVDINPGPIDTPAVISNPADEYQEALRIMAEQEQEA